MNNEKERVLEYLRREALGNSNKKKTYEIRDNLNLDSGGATNEHIRDLIFQYDVCIGSSRDGYWVIQTEEELENVCKDLEERADATRNRAEKLRSNWNNNG